jgi:hypothetical protein
MKLSKREQEQMEELFRWRGQKTEDKQLDYDPQILEDDNWVPVTIDYETCTELKQLHDDENGKYTYVEGYDNVNNRVRILKFLAREVKK